MRERKNRREFGINEVKDLLDYDPVTGILRWKITSNSYGGKIKPGDVAGSKKDGYCIIILFKRQYRAHHLAFLFMTGEWPPIDSDIDHKNRDRFDNSWDNLRIATRTQNNMNAPIRINNKSGFKGVSLRKDTGKWHARITIDKKIILLGNFENIEDAVKVRKEAEEKYFGSYAARL